MLASSRWSLRFALSFSLWLHLRVLPIGFADWEVDRIKEELTRVEQKLTDKELSEQQQSVAEGLVNELADKYNPELEAYRV